MQSHPKKSKYRTPQIKIEESTCSSRKKVQTKPGIKHGNDENNDDDDDDDDDGD
jgi:hypothetical protein